MAGESPSVGGRELGGGGSVDVAVVGDLHGVAVVADQGQELVGGQVVQALLGVLVVHAQGVGVEPAAQGVHRGVLGRVQGHGHVLGRDGALELGGDGGEG